MHIPDGYLSPASCVTLYGASAPFWYVAMRRVKKALHTSLIPRISLFAAFSFVVMMFNLPLPGGTTGHADGVAIAAIVLGPWAGMLAVSIAIAIQALFFGDGGITALGANCFNMAIVGSLVAWLVFKGLSRWTGKVVAAGLAGYIAINVSALLAAVEFGVQPMMSNLYCPYPLSVAVPAMMIGHLTIAGIAELTFSAGMMALIDPEPAAKKLKPALAVLVILTPLGILATGSAWGEWNVVARYGTASLTYMASALLGVSLIFLTGWALARLARHEDRR